MPLSEFYRMARERNESSQQKSTSTADLSHLPDNNEFVELVWENGQIMMQGPSSRARRDNNSNDFQSQVSKFGEQDLGNASNTKVGNGLMGTILDDFTATVPSSDLGLERDDDMAPWLNYDDPLHNNYNSDFFPGLSSITINDLPHDKKNTFTPTYGRNQPIGLSLRSGVSNVITDSIDHVNPANAQASSSAFSNTSSGIINFSHFSRPIALTRANPNNVSTVATAATASSSRVEATGLMSKVDFVPISNEMRSTRPNLLLKMVNKRNIGKPESVLHEDAVRNEAPSQQVDGVDANKETGEAEKAVEPVVASSSVCSGNNPEQCSDDQNQYLKRKSREGDDSEGRSEDVEEESVGIRKAAAPSRGGTGAKRSRAAEVHNLSERRRRDRINEKMRALQELIPNCNKVDKASMLDEAIEYLKTLQLQVQIMSMGAGLYMPHMMLPPGLPGHMAHFYPMMGGGMGMGMGFGMGMDRFHGPRAMSFSGPANYQMMPGPNLPVFVPSGSGNPVSAPHQPTVPTSTVPTTNPGGNEQAPDHLAKQVNGVPPS